MSKINMNSSGVHKVISSVETKYKDDRVESYIQYIDACKLRSNGMPVPLLRNGYSIFNGTKYR